MLVLSRRQNEKVLIGDGLIEVVVVEIRGDKVRLGFSAPDDVSVDRKRFMFPSRRPANAHPKLDELPNVWAGVRRVSMLPHKASCSQRCVD